ncbi:MAG: aminopeptidase [Pseudomonadota bacterium]
MSRRYYLMILFALLLLAIKGCENLSYYSQAIDGHLTVISSRKPVDRLIDDPRGSQDLREQLRLARDVRQFAIDRLALPDNESYRTFVDTERNYVSWAVFAAPPLALNVNLWCFPVVGCVPYRGYFSEEAADRFAAETAAQGFDVYVGGIPAYSTLGWFNDPLLNTMFLYGETYVAGVVFHELAHQQIYIPDDAAFNEAFAVSVEDSGTKLWLEDQSNQDAIRRYRTAQKRNQDFLALVGRTRDRLQRIYTSEKSDAQKLAEKEAEIERLRSRYRKLKRTKWDGFSGYDGWFKAPINNAKLATISVYNDLVPAFLDLLELCDGDYVRYYGAVESLGKLDRVRRREALTNASECV